MGMITWVVAVVMILAMGVLAARLARKKNVDLILRHAMTTRKDPYEGTKHVFFCLADHFEPFWKRVDKHVAIQRVESWFMSYPKIVDALRDKGGRPPQHSFFYPAEEYDPQCLAMLAELQQRGYGSVEIHLHHDRDTSEGVREKLLAFKDILHTEHGLLDKNGKTGEVEYAFIHGMFALDDSGPGGKWCGVKDEITILKETGCYADFTFPSAPDFTQPPIMNKIYYATDDPIRSKSHHTGVDAEFGRFPSGDLLMVNGPLAIDWRKRKKGFFPAIENGALTSNNPPSPRRADLWVRVGIAVRRWPNWIFVKVHTHGAQEAIASQLLNEGLSSLYSDLLRRYNDGGRFLLHFVRPREVYYCVKALEAADETWIKRIEDFDYCPPERWI